MPLSIVQPLTSDFERNLALAEVNPQFWVAVEEFQGNEVLCVVGVHRAVVQKESVSVCGEDLEARLSVLALRERLEPRPAAPGEA